MIRLVALVRHCGKARRPTLRIARAGRLRRRREDRGITLEAAGHTIGASNSKISRLQLGSVVSGAGNVADRLRLYGVTDAEQRQQILSFVRQATATGWWRQYGDVLPRWFETYLSLEQAASVIRAYESQLVPGLLQTQDYARAVLRLRHEHVSADEIDRRLALRMTRQAFLSQPDAPELWVALDEAVLRRPLGDQTVQRAQLLHLIEMAQRPNITLQIVPFDVSGHAAVGGPFTILRFAEPDLPDVLYLEHLSSALYLDQKHDTGHYLAIMDSLCIQAQSPMATIRFLQSIIDDSDS